MFECEKCGKTFKSKAGLTGHMGTHRTTARGGNPIALGDPAKVAAMVKARLEDPAWSEGFTRAFNKGVDPEIIARGEEATKGARVKPKGLNVILARKGYDIEASLRNGNRILIQDIGTPESKTVTLRPDQELVWVKG